MLSLMFIKWYIGLVRFEEMQNGIPIEHDASTNAKRQISIETRTFTVKLCETASLYKSSWPNTRGGRNTSTSVLLIYRTIPCIR